MAKLICPIRKKEVAATPEERVRASFLNFLFRRGFPKEFILVETPISGLPHLKDKILINRRVDILCYDKTFQPLLLVECKKKFNIDDLSQVLGYNHTILAPFIALVSEESVELRSKMGAPIFFKEFPSFSSLLSL